MPAQNPNAREALGPAERIVQSLLAYTDHAIHNRPGVVFPDARHNIGVRWEPCTHKVEGGVKVVYKLTRVGKKATRVRLGTLGEDGKVMNGGAAPVAEYRAAGIYPEVVAWFYRQIAEVWKVDNEFAARWASYAFPLEHRDLKVILAAFMLCQTRKGDPIKDGDDTFYDADFRDVGEAMCLLHRKDGKDLNPKMLLRVYEVLTLPQIAEINRELGFGRSAKNPFLGRWPAAVEKWLRHREQNPKLLDGLMKAGFRNTVQDLAERVHYKPETPKFFEAMRWPQKQYRDGRRTIAIGFAVKQAESWAGLSEEQVCQKIVAEKPAWKRLVSFLPATGLTRAMMAAAVETGCISDKELIILTPTIEEFGLLDVQEVRERWEKAMKSAEDMRAANIARNVKSKTVQEKLEQAADKALQKAVEEVARGLVIYVFVDISGSMNTSIGTAMDLLTRFLQGFPKDKLHVAVFNTVGREVVINTPSAAGVRAAFRGLMATGGTDYGAGIRALAKYKPATEEDALFIFVGDEGDQRGEFVEGVRASGLNPVAFGLVKLESQDSHWCAVTRTAAQMRLPLFNVEQSTFDDPYNLPRTVARLVAATPVAQVVGRTMPMRKSLVDEILATELLTRPAWA
jgi:hypothetical protein